MSGATKVRDLQAGTSGMMESTAMETEEYYNQEGGEWTQKVDTGQLCRVCASPNEYLIPIFDGEGLEHELATKIQKHLPIKVCETDTLPLHICYQCASTLIAWHDLVINCVEADKKLRELQVEEEDDDEDKGGEMFESHSMDSDGVDEVDQPSTSEAQSQVTKAVAVKKPTPSKQKKPKLKMVLVKGSADGTSGQKTGAKTQVAKTLELAKAKDGVTEESASERWSDTRDPLEQKPSVDETGSSEENDYTIWKDHSYFIPKEETEAMPETFVVYFENAADFEVVVANVQPSKFQNLVQYVKDVDGVHGESSKELDKSRYDCIMQSDVFGKTESEESIDTTVIINEEGNEVSFVGHKCEVCDSVFVELSDYETHIASHAKETLFSCQICRTTLKSISALQEHIRVHQEAMIEEKSDESKPSKNKFVSKFYVKKQVTYGREDIYECERCEKCFPSESSLKQHEIVHPEIRQHLCFICGSIFRKKTDLGVHMVSHFPQSNNCCLVCKESFPSAPALGKHLLSHTEDFKEDENLETKIQCHLCNFSFPSKISLCYHINTQHADRFYTCPKCKKQFNTKDSLNAHLADHERRKCMCKICGKILSSKKTLTDHERIHTGERPYQCHECGKSFRAMSGLHVHQALHSKLRPYVCSECGASFQRRTYLICHTRIHTGEKPYCCDICNRSFAYRTDMMKHRARHNK